ncbi:MAG: hypothetical protein AVDCRST_MAG95-1825 [uncultured Adhaeribacter sp.]|uniref:Uncharacterized protein n=1 Tax=uncultured Adhaeribacter sp. TaxID=448109 RepID=A0A6J4IGR6_9BACT|nr:MAG: hypothetical protein AVDCRST_MAG95-1825 [uncultured Adhaeribacter sp.]
MVTGIFLRSYLRTAIALRSNTFNLNFNQKIKLYAILKNKF